MFYNKNNKIIGMICLFVIFVTYTSKSLASEGPNDKKMVIIGGGHIGLIEAYSAHERAKRNAQPIRIKIMEKNSRIEQTTAANIWNSHTPDEIIAVVPRGTALEEALKSRFDEPGGIRIDDVPGINDSQCTKHFIEQAKTYGKNEAGHEKRTLSLLTLGKAGMQLWKQFYENADEPLKAILQESNFNPCCEINKHEKPALHKGYRVDLIYGINDAVSRAKSMTQTYQGLGYKNCKILSPDDVVQLDPFLAQFCDVHSVGQRAQREWKNDTSAIWRPGGCLNTQTFLPELVNYLKIAMGTYRGKNGQQKNRFQIKFNREVTGIVYGKETDDQKTIEGLKFADGKQTRIKTGLPETTYVFCPGEAVGTFHNLGLDEPAYAGFAGASLSLNIPISKNELENWQEYNHCMEVHKTGVCLAWQGRIRDSRKPDNKELFLGGAGTKAYYGGEEPTINEAFAKNRTLLQLQMFNDVVPQIVSLAFGKDTTGQKLTQQHMNILVEKGIAKRWVGRRGVLYDGFPIIGHLYCKGKQVSNARGTAYFGSGGGSFALIASLVSHYALHPEDVKSELETLGLNHVFLKSVLEFSDSRRVAKESD